MSNRQADQATEVARAAFDAGEIGIAAIQAQLVR